MDAARLSRAAHVAAFSLVGVAAVLFVVTLRGPEATGWGAAAVLALAAAFLLAPLSLLLAAWARAAPPRRTLATDALLCALGALVAGAAALSPGSGGRDLLLRALAALVAALDGWGLLVARRLWRR